MRTLLIALSFVCLSLSVNAADEIIKVKEYDVYKSSADIKKNATNVRIHDFKLKNAKSKKITYRTTCYRNDNDRKSLEKREEYSCVKVRFERVQVARVKFRYDSMVMTRVGGRDNDRMELKNTTFRGYFNMKVAALDATTVRTLENRPYWFPNRAEFRGMANDLYTLNLVPSRTSLKVSISSQE